MALGWPATAGTLMSNESERASVSPINKTSQAADNPKCQKRRSGPGTSVSVMEPGSTHGTAKSSDLRIDTGDRVLVWQGHRRSQYPARSSGPDPTVSMSRLEFNKDS